jgi:hypothetical protein
MDQRSARGLVAVPEHFSLRLRSRRRPGLHGRDQSDQARENGCSHGIETPSPAIPIQRRMVTPATRILKRRDRWDKARSTVQPGHVVSPRHPGSDRVRRRGPCDEGLPSLFTPIPDDFTIDAMPLGKIGHPSSADQAALIPERLDVLYRRRRLDRSGREPECEQGSKASEGPPQCPDDSGFTVAVGNQDREQKAQSECEQTREDDREGGAVAFPWITVALRAQPALAETKRYQRNPVEVSQVERAPLLGQHGLAAVIAPIIAIRNELGCEAIMSVDEEHGIALCY